jgi:uncharacterized protein
MGLDLITHCGEDISMSQFTSMSLDERFGALDDEKARFVSKVYGGLTFSLMLATVACVAAIAWFSSMPQSQVYGIWKVLRFVELGLVIASMFIRLNGPFGWAFVMSFVTVTAVTLAPILMIYERIAGVGTIAGALGLTGAIFLTLTGYVRYSGKDFTYLGGFLCMATIGLLLTGLALMFFPSANVSYWYSCIGALIFSGWILFDTSAVTRQYYHDDNVPGAVLMLYVDILNLFLFLLRILSNRSDD